MAFGMSTHGYDQIRAIRVYLIKGYSYYKSI